MKAFKIIKWFLFLVYLILALLWALNIGLSREELLKYDGNKNYDNIVVDLSESYKANTGDLLLCMSGYLKDSKKYRVKLSSFSVIIPIDEISKTIIYEENGISINSTNSYLSVSDKSFGEECNTLQNKYSKIKVGKINLTKEESYSFNEFKYFKSLELDADEKVIIVSVPNYSYSDGLYPKVLDIFIVRNEPDMAGRKYYALKLEDSLVNRKISFGEYTKAFIIDFIMFPVQLYMFFNWH